MTKNNLFRCGGFTFIELVVAVGVLGIMATAGVAVFSRSLRGSSQVEMRRTLDDRARLILDSLARFLREGRVMTLTGQGRTACLGSGSITGDSLVVRALDGLNTTFSISNGQLSSASGTSVVLNPTNVTVGRKSGLDYYFTWYCQYGIPDRLVMEFEATATGVEGESGISNDYILDLVMRNSGQ